MKISQLFTWKKEYTFYSDKSIEALKSEIQEIFDKKSRRSKYINLKGEFTSSYTFKASPEWQLIYIRNFERDVAYINGEIIQDEQLKTSVKFTARPNFIFPLFFFSFSLPGINLFTTSNRINDKDSFQIGLFFIFIAPIVMLFLGLLARNKIKNRFVNTFSLRS